MDAMHPSRAYGLGFVPKAKTGRRRCPELVLSVARRDVAHIERSITRLYEGLARTARTYLDESLAFSWPSVGQLELPLEKGDPGIGYRSCGRLSLTDDEARLRLPLREAHLKETALTLAVLLELLGGLPRAERTSNRPQLMDVKTLCRREAQWAHPIHGWVYPSARTWLSSHAGEMPPSVIAAMREAWKATAPKDIKHYADECQAGITKDGRFLFSCFGNACDVSIYPDSLGSRDEDTVCSFDCHNLDAAFQQLTLIAGIAAMLQLMEEH